MIERRGGGLLGCLIMLVMLALLSACGSDTERQRSSFVHLPDYGWEYGDTLTFDFAADGSVPEIGIRHNDAYKYRNLWLEVSRRVDSVTVIADTLNVELCNAYGRWYGRGFGGSYQLQLPLPERMRVSPVNIRHIMRVDTLWGIEDIGIVPGN